MTRKSSGAALALFWASITLIIYSYVLFPLLVIARGALAARKGGSRTAPTPIPNLQSPVPNPPFSLIIAAHNEASIIGRKIESVLASVRALDNPTQCRELIIASDGSDDGTEEVVARYAALQALDLPLAQPSVHLLALPRMGKAAALNAAVQKATGEILIFSDANSLFAPHSLQALLEPFADPYVGGVAGNQVYMNGDGPVVNDGRAQGGDAGVGERLYWAFDRQLKQYQSRAGNVISATGALYALRRELFQPIPDGVTDDFYNSVGVIAQGRRLVFAPEAVAYEAVAATGRKEFGRKVRVMTRGLAAVVARRELLDPRRYGWYAWQLLSHKVLRRLVSVPLLVLALVSPRLWRRGRLYKVATLGQLLVYGAAAAGALLERQPPAPAPEGRAHRAVRRLGARLCAVTYYFVLVNLAALLALLNLIRGRRIVQW